VFEWGVGAAIHTAVQRIVCAFSELHYCPLKMGILTSKLLRVRHFLLSKVHGGLKGCMEVTFTFINIK
jgi:hypothetical protein